MYTYKKLVLYSICDIFLSLAITMLFVVFQTRFKVTCHMWTAPYYEMYIRVSRPDQIGLMLFHCFLKHNCTKWMLFKEVNKK